MSQVADNLARLHDSSARVGDSSALRAAMDEDGYLFLPGLLDRQQVAALRSDVCRVLADVGWLERDADPLEARPGPVAHRHDWQDLEWFDGYVGIQRLEAFHALAHDSALCGVLAGLVGDDPLLVHPMKIARITFPGGDFPTPAHQDFFFNPASPDTYTAWVPLGDFDKAYGGLRLLPGSHRAGQHEHVAQPGAGGNGVDVDLGSPEWRSADYQMGDVLLFNALTVHHAPVNRADRLRLSADYRYQSVREPILQACLEPSDHWFANGTVVPGWDDLAADWSSLASISVPPGLHVVPHPRATN